MVISCPACPCSSDHNKVHDLESRLSLWRRMCCHDLLQHHLTRQPYFNWLSRSLETGDFDLHALVPN